MAVVCPQCGKPVPWGRRLFKAQPWAKWNCAGCGAKLKFDMANRIWRLILPVYGMAFLIISPYGQRIPWIGRAILLPVLLVGGPFLMVFAERIVILEYGRGHCRDCGYNLTGLTASRCPECGKVVEPRVKEDDET